MPDNDVLLRNRHLKADRVLVCYVLLPDNRVSKVWMHKYLLLDDGIKLDGLKISEALKRDYQNSNRFKYYSNRDELLVDGVCIYKQGKWK